MRFLALTLGIVGCDTEIPALPPPPAIRIDDGSIAGRVCAPDGRTWLANAQAHLNVVADNGVIIATRTAYTDLDGSWKIKGIPGEREYTYYVRYGRDILESDTVFIAAGQHYVIPSPDCFSPPALSVAVVHGDFDDFHQLLDQMDLADYVLIDGLNRPELAYFLDSADELAKYDVIFLNSGFVEDHVIYDTELDDREAAKACAAGPCPASRMANLRSWVENGGQLYVSDWAYDVVEIGWPDRATFVGTDTEPGSAELGDALTTNATISDEKLAQFLGTESLPLTYDVPAWIPVESVDASVLVHVSGDVTYTDGPSSFSLSTAPLLFSFDAGDGRVVYSTFRVVRNASEDVVAMLEYLMYRL